MEPLNLYSVSLLLLLNLSIRPSLLSLLSWGWDCSLFHDSGLTFPQSRPPRWWSRLFLCFMSPCFLWKLFCFALYYVSVGYFEFYSSLWLLGNRNWWRRRGCWWLVELLHCLMIYWWTFYQDSRQRWLANASAYASFGALWLRTPLLWNCTALVPSLDRTAGHYLFISIVDYYYRNRRTGPPLAHPLALGYGTCLCETVCRGPNMRGFGAV